MAAILFSNIYGQVGKICLQLDGESCIFFGSQSKQPLTEEICLLSETMTYTFPQRNRGERHDREFILFDPSS